MRKRGFSLLELMITLGVLTIVATVAVPKVQVWNARNRGLKTVMELISDFSKAKSVAGYTVAVDSENGRIEIPRNVDLPDGGGTMPVYMGIRRQTALMFGKTEYAIYQKDTMDNTWDNSAFLLKKNTLMNTLTLEKVNGNTVPDSMTSFEEAGLLTFTSTGKLKTAQGKIVTTTSNDAGKCGSTSTTRYLQNVIFSAVLRSKISKDSTDSIWYRVEIDQRGEYSICTVLGGDSVSFDNNGMLLDM